ncbi:MAG: hypothetical protein VW862_09055, partial [Euryarchaeota archaeon]
TCMAPAGEHLLVKGVEMVEFGFAVHREAHKIAAIKAHIVERPDFVYITKGYELNFNARWQGIEYLHVLFLCQIKPTFILPVIHAV